MEIVELGNSRLHPASNSIEIQCQGPALAEGQAPDYGEAPLFHALGLSARPAPANQNGSAQGIRADVPGTTGVIIGCQDVRSAENYFNLGPGETCLHATGEDFDSRILCKKQLLSIVVGDDMVLNLDREAGEISIVYEGRAFMLSKKQGCVLTDGEGATIHLKGGVIRLEGQLSTGARGGVPHYFALSPVPAIPSPATGLVAAPGATYTVG